jgi:hypothetical protein
VYAGAELFFDPDGRRKMLNSTRPHVVTSQHNLKFHVQRSLRAFMAQNVLPCLSRPFVSLLFKYVISLSFILSVLCAPYLLHQFVFSLSSVPFAPIFGINWITWERRLPRPQIYGDDRHFHFVLKRPLACAALPRHISTLNTGVVLTDATTQVLIIFS